MSKYNILIVDDEPANLFLLEEVLSDYVVTSANNGIEMIKELQKSLPDMILLDIMMPGIDGLSLARQLKSNQRFWDIPIIIISAKGSGEDVAHGLLKGADDYIKKPFDNEELIARIEKLLRNKEKRIELYNKATRDNLTGAFNREYFYEYLSLKIKKSERSGSKFSVGILDIDHFKKINDTWGHQAGDTVLVNLTQYVVSQLREYDILARFGGEEFIFIIDGALKDQAFPVIDRIRDHLSGTVLDRDNNITITFSCGLSDITESRDQDDTINKLVQIADRRLYIAKNSGRNRVIFND